MNRILSRLAGGVVLNILCMIMLSTNLYAAILEEHEYVDFSSDRSTYFFRLEGGDNETVFFDFFSPFDPTVKVKTYDPLIMYKLDNAYYLDNNNVLMIHIEDLKKLYAPYFSYEIVDDVLYIRHTVYDKLITDGFGERSTTLEYTKKVWDMQIPLKNANNSGTYSYTEYLPTTGGRNKNELVDTEVNKEKSTSNNPFTFEKGKIEKVNDAYYVPITQIMDIMGKVSIEEEGYLAVQQENLADVTVAVERSASVDEVIVPKASNVWNPGSMQAVDAEYTWADYMNDVADGKRTTGWLWKSFYIPSGTYFKDGNGETITLEADRIVPFNIYVPTGYDKETTKLTYMLHGGTGNENTPTHRLIEREVNMDEYAEEYNYIIVSPNGWTQDPIWREGQALYSFEKSYEMVMKEFPVNEDKVFISGNSLGGRGTLELAMRFPERFKAIVASAPKIADRASSGKGTVINIEDTTYDLASIKDLPAMIIQGTADSTTSYKTQIGTQETPGSIAKAVMSKLENATYVTVEKGNHTYSYASTMTAMFEFFESAIDLDEKGVNFTTLNLQENSKVAKLDDKKYKLQNSTQMIDGVLMIALEDLEAIYGDTFKVYTINSYDTTPKLGIDYYTIIYNNKSINFTLNETIYRKNMERYKEDAGIIKSGAGSDEDLLESAPHFSIAPYEADGKIYVPANDLLSALNLNMTMSEAGVDVAGIVAIMIIPIIVAGLVIGMKKWKSNK